MLHLLFTVYDVKAEVYMPPFFVPTIGLATRAFADCVNSKDHQFGKHPHDYTLFQLGSFDDSDASISQTDNKSLGNGVEYIDPKHTSAVEEFENGPHRPPIQPDKNS